ncbi:protein ACCELERATED CELL DEATH 6-like [Alnus glutinosa]|uniref:protein ACCELERATED CELL DEATH 6-like n=1 Tax=Alnus glutinosa TaxID=3517 RepID=UPI002D78B827|nr:protein ACCELERATED CELL DEATH 6-like [Alnus glutinosa]
MDCDSFNAAAEGKIKVFKDIITDHQSLDLLLTPNKNTVLHIYITSLNSGLKDQNQEQTLTKFVEEILEICPPLLRQTNVKDETPLHIAARYGHDDIVEVLIKYCAQTLPQDPKGGIESVKEMLSMTNKEKDTALHEAVRYNHLKVVKLLIKTDPNFSYSANNAGETPLYIAAERGFEDVVIEILDKCKSPMHEGPLGRTALHAAVIRNYEGITRRILDKIEGISRIVNKDDYWTPLHFAAYFTNYQINYSTVARMLLDKDREVAYKKDKEGRTALHIAAQEGNVHMVSLIVSRCPDCCELVDKRGWNVLHFAFEGKYPSLLEYTIEVILRNSSLSNLLNEKNADGDTPLHFYSNFEGLAKNFIGHPRVDKMAFNQKNLSAWNIAVANIGEFPKEKKSEIWKNFPHPQPQRVIDNYTIKQKEKKKIREEKTRTMLKDASQAHLVVGALITTVTFAACITMPGGFVGSGEGSSHPGSALLRKNAAFTAFIITDTISMVLSSSAVFIHLLIPILSDTSHHSGEKLLSMAFLFILGAMIAMVLAFVTGTFVVLMPSLGLAIANCFIGLTFFAIIFFVFPKFVFS